MFYILAIASTTPKTTATTVAATADVTATVAATTAIATANDCAITITATTTGTNHIVHFLSSMDLRRCHIGKADNFRYIPYYK